MGLGRWRTCLHAHETVPGVVGAAVADSGDEAARYDGDVRVLKSDLSLEIIHHATPIALTSLRGPQRPIWG